MQPATHSKPLAIAELETRLAALDTNDDTSACSPDSKDKLSSVSDISTTGEPSRRWRGLANSMPRNLKFLNFKDRKVPDVPSLPSDSSTINELNDSGYSSLNPTPTKNRSYSSQKLGVFPRPASTPGGIEERFLDLKTLHRQALLEAISKGRKGPGDVSMKLRYMGTDDESARPYIVIHCDKRVTRRIKSYFEQSHVLEDLGSDFQLHIVDTGFISLAGDVITVLADFDKDSPTLCGTSVLFRGRHGTDMPEKPFGSSALGGLIICNDDPSKIFGITAGHLRPPLNENRLGDSASLSSEEEEEEEDDDDDDGGNNEHDVIPRELDVDLQSYINLGEVLHDPISEKKRNYDWSLITIHHWKALKPNRLNISPFRRSEYMPLVLSMQRPLLSDHFAFGTPAFLIRQTLSRVSNWLSPSRELPPDPWTMQTRKPVLVVTPHGNQRGILVFTGSSMLSKVGEIFVDTLDFLPDPGAVLRPGDSGSWVVCGNTGTVYGHLVAVDSFGEAYVMPIHETLQEVKSLMPDTHSVSLPTEQQVWDSLRPPADSGYSSMVTTPRAVGSR